MAQKINLRQSEYGTIVTELEKMHTEQLQNAADIIAEMRSVVTSGDVFKTDQTSQKVADMLDMVSGEVMALLEQAFQSSETGVTTMIASVMATDTACG